MESSGQEFKNSLRDAFGSVLGKTKGGTADLMKDMVKFTGSMKEEEQEDLSDEKKSKKINAKSQFAKDLQSDEDFIDFKKRTKYKKGGAEFTFGTPNVTVDDPYIDKRKYSRPGKEEPKEATGSGSSGAYSGPLFGGESKFLKKSQSETPKLKEGLDVSSDFEKVEATEATGSGSVGSYSTPAMWAKSTKKKDWGPSRKTQLPGGSFVSVKKKCTKFPYCNQGDIKALNIYKNESVKNAISKVSQKLNLSETTIKAIIEFELEKLNKR